MINYLSSKSDLFIFIFLFVTAFAVRLSALVYFNFDGFYGQDAYAYADFTRRFYDALSGFSLPPNLYWPIGYYLFTSVFTLFTGENINASALFVSMNASSLAAGFIYLLSTELFAKYYDTLSLKRISVLAGLIMCFAGAVIKSGIVVMSDALGMMFIILSALFIVKYLNRPKTAYMILCFVFLASGTMTRYASGLFTAVIAAVVIYAFIKRKSRKKPVYDIVISILIGILVYSPQLYYNISYGISYFQFEGLSPTWAASWNPLNLFRKDFVTFDGTMNYRFWNGLQYASPVFHPMFLSLFGFVFIYGLYCAVRTKRTLILLFCLSWTAVYYLYLSGTPYQSIRYTLSFFPPLVLLAAYGFTELKISNAVKSSYAAVCILLLAAYAYYDTGRLAESKKSELEVIEWINNKVPPGSELFTFFVTGAVNHYTDFRAREFHNYNYTEIRSVIDSSRTEVYFVLPVHKINSQWKDLPMEKKLDSLLAGERIKYIGSINGFDGFRTEKTGVTK